MNGRSIALHLSLLVVTLLAAWITFRAQLGADTTGDDEGVVLVQAAAGDVEALDYVDRGRTLHLEARRDAKGRWFEGTETVATPGDGENEEPVDARDEGEAASEGNPPAGEDEAATPAESPERTEIFRGGRAVEDLWRELEPLRVTRVLGELDAVKLQELGLAEPAASLDLIIRQRDYRLDLGDEIYGGAGRYARTSDGRVVVLPVGLIRDLESGRARLMERRLIQATRPEVDSLELARGGSSLEIVQHDASQPAESYWTRAGEEEPSGELQTWTDKFFRLEARGYRSEEPGPGWQNEATITVASREVGRERLEIWSVADEGGRVWLARSAHTRLVAELGPLAEEVSSDLDSLLP